MRIRTSFLTVLAVGLLPMMAAATEVADLLRSGERDAALAAVRNGADVNAVQGDGSTALLWAVHRIDHEMVAALLERGANPDVRNLLGTTPLLQAMAVADMPLIETLLKAKADPNLGNEDDQTPLMLAARSGPLQLVQMLVQAGANVNVREKLRQQTALMWAAGAGNADVTEFLVQHKAEVDVRAEFTDWGNQLTSEPRTQYRPVGGLTPLLYATRSGCVACARALLDGGADINRPSPEGVTPLMNAIDNAQYELANFLLDRGANPHLQDWWGRTALYVAADMRTRGGGGGGRGAGPGPGGPAGVRATDAPAPRPQHSALQVVQRLLEEGVNPNTQLNMHRPFRGRFTDDLLNTGCTPLLRAAVSVDREVVALLLAHGALPDLPSVMGVTPLMAAAGMGYLVGASAGGQGPIGGADPQSNSIAVIGMLIAAGADVNARITDTSSRTALIARPSSMTDRAGQTALFGAVGNGNGVGNGRNWTRVAQYLIDNGAQLDVKDEMGRTILDALEGKAGGRDEPSTEEMVKVVTDAVRASGALPVPG